MAKPEVKSETGPKTGQPYVLTDPETDQLRRFRAGQMPAPELHELSNTVLAVFAAVVIVAEADGTEPREVKSLVKRIQQMFGVSYNRAADIRRNMARWKVAEGNGLYGPAARTTIVLPSTYQRYLAETAPVTMTAMLNDLDGVPAPGIPRPYPEELARRLDVLVEMGLPLAFVSGSVELLEEAQQFVKRRGPDGARSFAELVLFFAKTAS